tara:strand:- start:304 stop:453 length:150 start_codon:yes stop_codon:yes gene_type:complete
MTDPEEKYSNGVDRIQIVKKQNQWKQPDSRKDPEKIPTETLDPECSGSF